MNKTLTRQQHLRDLPRGFGSKNTKNVTTILFQNINSQQKETEKSTNLQQQQSIFNFGKTTPFRFVFFTAT